MSNQNQTVAQKESSTKGINLWQCGSKGHSWTSAYRSTAKTFISESFHTMLARPCPREETGDGMDVEWIRCKSMPKSHDRRASGSALDVRLRWMESSDRC